MINKNIWRGFTLIELLIVVLIIGVLAAISFAQYQKIVDKTQAMQGLSLAYQIARAEQFLFMEKGVYSTQFDQLDVPFKNWDKTGSFLVNTFRDTRSNNNWLIQSEVYSSYTNIFIVNKTGKYKGAGFVYSISLPFEQIKTPQILCFERTGAAALTLNNKGKFCEKVMKGSFITNDPWTRYFSLKQ